MNVMKEFERMMGSQRELLDEWNTLGWRFKTMHDFDTDKGRRICEVFNYSEAKAEGGKFSFYLKSKKGFDPVTSPVELVVWEESGSGPHGVPWYDFLLCGEDVKSKQLAESLTELVTKVKKACAEEAITSYWQPACYPEETGPYHTWAVQPYGADYTYLETTPYGPDTRTKEVLLTVNGLPLKLRIREKTLGVIHLGSVGEHLENVGITLKTDNDEANDEGPDELLQHVFNTK